ncbi:hypothetical protein [uncultured Treponema sp.]|uniref:hypothetical protein n=1 Tax=uncultured Treponema sp. TaxID=162155 RepID=UPI0025EB2C72|nr:hypothetical protein [uncultured Treponema sp.]
MTKDDLIFMINTKREFEFTYNGKNYNLTYDRDDNGNDLILFGERFQGKKYTSFGELMNEARIENHFFREMLDIL